jgi:DNA-directed RNA polymerase specialized sigma24 family protein
VEPAAITAARWPSSGAFEECYTRVYPSLVRLTLVTTRSLPIAEEITQDAFAELWQHRQAVREPEAWLRRVVTRRSVSWLRRLVVERRVPPQPAGPAVPESVTDFLAHLTDLTPRQRVVVFLRYHEDLSDEEIARVIGRSTRVVRSLAWRAIDKLRREMSDDRV